MAKPKQDPAMLLFAVAGIFVAIILSQIGVLPGMGGGDVKGATVAGLLGGGGERAWSFGRFTDASAPGNNRQPARRRWRGQ